MVDENDLFWAIWSGDVEGVRSMCAEQPSFIRDYLSDGKTTWMNAAAKNGDVSLMATLLELGFNIDALRLPEKSTALVTAIGCGHLALVKYLLSHGANPNLSRPLIAAMNCDKDEDRVELVNLLIEHGVDVNQLFPLYGDENDLFTALDWATSYPEIAQLLRAHGAKTAAELLADDGREPAARATDKADPLDDVVAYFNEHFGPVDEKAHVEILPTEQPIAIHAIEPGDERQHLTLFTAGLSSEEMNAPPGQEEYALAELFIQLPADWQHKNLSDPNYSWPILWMRKIALYPHAHDTWLGGPLTIVANDDPPQPLGPNVEFTSWLLFAEFDFERSDGRTVQLYRMTPIYTEERKLEMAEGAPALLEAFDRAGVSFIVDLNRKNVATEG